MESQINKVLKKSYISLDRAEIINYSLQLETYINVILKKSLSINNKTSIAFGNSSRALSFNNKIVLLQDLEGISKNDQTLLTKFSEIRNKFAHVLDCHFAKNFFEMDNTGTLNYLEKRYKLNLDYSQNDNCLQLIEYLVLDIEQILVRILDTIKKNEFNVGKAYISSKLISRLLEVIDDNKYYESLTGETNKDIVKCFLRKLATEVEIDQHTKEMEEYIKKFKLI